MANSLGILEKLEKLTNGLVSLLLGEVTVDQKSVEINLNIEVLVVYSTHLDTS